MSDEAEDFAAIEAGMKAAYDRQASFWHGHRSRDLRERKALGFFLEGLPAGSRLLDLGCGSGVPVAAYFRDQGFVVTGLDFSAEMIAIAKSGDPEGDWRVADMRDFDAVERYHGICSWDAFFHLTPADQRRLLPKLAAGVCEGGAFMTTVGPGHGEVLGAVGDDPVYHSSLSHDEYLSILTEAGFREARIISSSEISTDRTILLGRNRRAG